MKTKYFRHKTGSSEDPRFKKLVHYFGWEGYGIYFAIVDQIKINKNKLSWDPGFKNLAEKFHLPMEKMEALSEHLFSQGLLNLKNNRITIPVAHKTKKQKGAKATEKPTKCPITNKKCPLLENGVPIAKTGQNQETLPLAKYSITELFDKFQKLHKNLQNQIIRANSKKYHILPDNTVTIRAPT